MSTLGVAGNVAVNTDKFTITAASGNTAIAGTLNVTDTITGPGSGITDLNADNIASGTVGTARLGSGMANNTTFLRGDQTWATPTASSSVDLQIFTSSGTWNKPGSGIVTHIECWGAGGGGGRGQTTTSPTGSGGGGGGGYNDRWLATTSLSSSESVTLGTGGAGRSGSDGAGGVGGNTTFGSHLTAYDGGTGGDIQDCGESFTCALGGTGGEGTQDGAIGSSHESVRHAGGSATVAGSGGDSIYGGAGGAAGTGNGVNGTSGTQPGGGGACRGATCGSGAAGQCKLTVLTPYSVYRALDEIQKSEGRNQKSEARS